MTDQAEGLDYQARSFKAKAERAARYEQQRKLDDEAWLRTLNEARELGLLDQRR
jgi:hypothetical protein